VGCDVAFAPQEEEIYPEPQEYKLHPPARLADILEGQVRPGFFTGVCTVVLKLFHAVQPDAAVFGKKDYQQLLVIRSMLRQLMLPIKLITAETVRASTGLALSSRNGYLTDAQRSEAAQLNSVLTKAVAEVKAGRTDWDKLEREASDALSAHGWLVDYVAIRRQSDLALPLTGDRLVVLGAARLAGSRLIDNLEI